MMSRTTFRRVLTPVVFAAVLSAIVPSRAAALEVLCDTAFENCRTRLLTLIDNEQVGIDVGFWVMEDSRFYNHLIARKNAGVPIRVIIDTRSVASYPLNQSAFDALQQAGIPLIKKTTGGIMHWKTMIFAGQNVVEFGSANFSDFEFVASTPYTNYISQTIYFTDDPAIVNSLKTKFDDLWVDANNYSVYANVSTRTRVYPTFPISPDLNIPPGSGQSYATRLIKLENAEKQKIDVAMYRITQQSHGDAMIAAVKRGIPVRYIGEFREYRLLSRLWVSFNMDRMWAGGVPMRVGVHQGLNHQKLVLLYGQGLSVFGSGNWTSPSDNSQQEHNYFTTKSWMFTWFQQQFDRQWNNSTGNIETADFTPQPPDKPTNVSIANLATGVATTGQKLVWYGGPWAHYYDIYFGTDPNANALLASEQPLGPSQTTTQNQSFALPTLLPGTTYYWRIVSKTAAGLSTTPRTCATCQKSGPIWSFTTSGTPPPPPPPPNGATTIVMWTKNITAANVHGNWTAITDATAAGGTALQNTNNSAGKISPALAAPPNYFEQTFQAQAGAAYHLYVRMRAQSNSLSNDSVHVQFSDSVDQGGAALYRIGTSSSNEIVLQNGSADPSVNNWGWADNNWNGTAPSIYFATTGTHTVRIQQREDGAIIDQIVLSPDTYFLSAPGPRDNDATILPSTDGTGGGGGGGGTGQGASIVMWGAHVPAANLHGNWSFASDATAAGGTALLNTNNNAAKTSPPLATPVNYFEQTFTADAGKAYHLWIRMRATGNSLSNDSISVQFSDSVDTNGNAIMRIGSAAGAEIVLQSGASDPSINGWGWADANWNGPAAPVSFAASGTHTIRVQQREDGPLIDQIVLSPDAFLSSPPGPRDNDATILTSTDDTGGGGGGGTGQGASIVMWGAHVPAANLNGNWSFASDATAAGGTALLNTNNNAAKTSPPLASPVNYFEQTFTADAGKPYHLWIRMRATGNSMSNDSVSIQFNDSVDAGGNPSMQIASANGAEIVLQNGSSDPSINGWGWADANWNGPAAPVYFATSGTHTVRVQQREDGPVVDQIVLSPDAFLTAAPGPRDNDATILAENPGG